MDTKIDTFGLADSGEATDNGGVRLDISFLDTDGESPESVVVYDEVLGTDGDDHITGRTAGDAANLGVYENPTDIRDHGAPSEKFTYIKELHLGDGDDYLDVEQTNDLPSDTYYNAPHYSVHGGEGDDTLVWYKGTELFGDEGDDTLRLKASVADIFWENKTGSASGGDGDDLFEVDLTNADSSRIGTATTSPYSTPLASIPLTGGEGADTFSFNSKDGQINFADKDSDHPDVEEIALITDFTAGEDTIVLEADEDAELFDLTSVEIIETEDGTHIKLDYTLKEGAAHQHATGYSGSIWLPGATGVTEGDIEIVAEGGNTLLVA